MEARTKKVVATDARVGRWRHSRIGLTETQKGMEARDEIPAVENTRTKKVVMGGVRVMGCGHSGSGTGRDPNQECRHGKKVLGRSITTEAAAKSSQDSRPKEEWRRGREIRR